MTVEEVIDRRGITEVLHFTTNQGLLGMLPSGGILSRERLPKEKYLEHVYKPNAPVRHDSDWLDYVNLSITTINTEFFGHSSRWRQDQEVWWCVVSLEPAVLTHAGVVFATTNNIYSGVQRVAGAGGLEALFAERVTRFKGFLPPWREGQRTAVRSEGMPHSVPTCVQAEVLYPHRVLVEHFRQVYVATGDHADIVGSQAAILLPPGVDHPGTAALPVIIRPEVFEA
jgi:hypothetical protein